MNLQQLITLTDKLYYADTSSYKVILSKQKELAAFIGYNTDITKINNTTINKYIQYLQNKGNNNATINSKLAYLSKLLTTALHNEKIKYKPYIPTLKVKTTKEKYLNDAEISLMLQWTINNNQKELHDIILIGLNMGLRINNILSISTNNIDNNYLRIIENKTNKPYSIPLNNTMQELFKNFKPFTLNYNQVYYLFNLMKQELNLDKNITIHTLRHTFCSKLVQKGIPITTIQLLANHKKITTTMRYTHLNNKQLEYAVSVL